MGTTPLEMQWIDTSRDRAEDLIGALREKLSPRGDIVSPAGRQKTIALFGEALTPQQVVERICRDVAERGLEAVLDYTARIDGAELTAETIRVPEDALRAAHDQADPELLAAVRRVEANIRTFQEAILHRDVRVERNGGYLAQRYRPLRRAGICVPGGAAAYPSSALMTIVPARVAGVEEIAVVAPPTPFGAYNVDMLATCWELGVREVYRVGGAQAVAAMAFGVDQIPQVDKIVGPGNLFVALAKKHVYGSVDIDSIAGPSEVVVIVDDSTRADYTAFDLLAQAEHAPGASILIGWQPDVLRTAVEAVGRRLDEVERAEAARSCLEEFGAVILARDADEACRITDAIAPEHLHIATRDAEALADRIQYAGAMFLGNYTPVALGDYAAGPSHVLPTSGTARFASGLTANDFLRTNSILSFQHEGMRNMAEDVRILATKEGLTAHRESVQVRMAAPDG